MKKNVFSLMLLCCFAFTGVAYAQEGIKLTVNDDVNINISETRSPVVLTYTPESATPAGFAGIGMAFHWGYMFPVEMIADLDGKYITQVGYVDVTTSAGEYAVNIWQGGDNAPATMVYSQGFTMTGLVNDIVLLSLDEPVLINGGQNLWVTFYQDGSVESPACVITDTGEPNSRWIGVDGAGWFDMGTLQGGAGYSFVLWAVADDYDVIGETECNVAVYPNPTQNYLNVIAPGTSRITLMNALGQMVYDMPVDSDSEVIDMSQFPNGIYMVRVASDNGVSVKRISKSN